MTRTIARPDELDLDSPGRRDYWVALEHDSTWGDHLIPLTVMVGPHAKSGEGLVAFGSNHGNEYEGPVALKHLLGEIDIADVTGRLILIPVPALIVTQAIGHVIPGLYMLHGSQTSCGQYLRGGPNQGGNPQRKRHHHPVLMGQAFIPEPGQVLVVRGHGLFQI